MSMTFSGQVALVTGGQGHANAAAARLGARPGQPLRALVEEIAAGA